MFRKSGQSTLEYVIVLTAIVVALLVAAAAYLRPKLQSSISHVSNQMESGVKVIHFGP